MVQDKRPLEDMEHTSPAKKRSKNMAHFRILFPGAAAGRIIGKKGENIKHIREKCQPGAYIRVPESPNAPERILMISCDMADVSLIMNALAPKIFEGLPAGQSEKELCLLVPADQAGIVLGKGGSTIAKLREDSGAKGKLYKDKLPLCDERVLLLQGELECMVRAIVTVVGLLMETPLTHQCIQYAPHTVTLADYPENCGGYVRQAEAAKKDNTALMYSQYAAYAGYPGYEQYPYAEQDPKGYSTAAATEHVWAPAEVQPPAPDPYSSAGHQVPIQGYTPATQLYDRSFTDRAYAEQARYTDQTYAREGYPKSEPQPAPAAHDPYSANAYGASAHIAPPVHSAHAANVHGMDEDFMDEEIIKEIKISNHLTGHIIGPKGANIAQIRKSTPATIKIGDDDSVSNDQRHITIKGSMRSVMTAYQMLKQLIVEANTRISEASYGTPQQHVGPRTHLHGPDPSSDSELLQRIKQQFPYQECPDDSPSTQIKEITIDNHHTGCVIGSKGATIAEIRRVTKCRVIIANDSEVSSNERLITLTGTPRAISLAQYMLQAVIQMGN